MKARRATIRLRDGRIYIADRVDLSGRRLTFTGRLRVRDLSGERYYATNTRTVALGHVRAIDWHRAER